MSNYKFKIGDKVRIRKDSEYYIDNTKNNPADIVGEIYEIVVAYDHNYYVNWENGGDNSYREEDLELTNFSVTNYFKELLTNPIKVPILMTLEDRLILDKIIDKIDFTDEEKSKFFINEIHIKYTKLFLRYNGMSSNNAYFVYQNESHISFNDIKEQIKTLINENNNN